MLRNSRALLTSVFRTSIGIQRRQLASEVQPVAQPVRRVVEKRKRPPAPRTADTVDETSSVLNTEHFKALVRPPTAAQKRKYRRRWDWYLRHLIYAMTTPLLLHIFLTGVEYYMKHYATLEQLEASSLAYKEKIGLVVRDKLLGTSDTPALLQDDALSIDESAAGVEQVNTSRMTIALNTMARRLDQVEAELEELIEIRRTEHEMRPGDLVLNKARAHAKTMSRANGV